MSSSNRLRFVFITVGVLLALVSILLLVYAFSPGADPLRLQATLAPTLFIPPGGAP